jgi:predicted GNAT family acetyltransferase
MEVVALAEAEEFLERAEPLLLEDEARHNLILGIASTLRDAPGVYEQWHLWLVQETGAVRAAALRTPPFDLVLAKPGSDDALLALADELSRSHSGIPGVTGSVPEVDRFATAWHARTGMRPRVRMRQRVYQAMSIRAPEEVPGSARRATTADRELLVTWLEAFAAEAFEGVDRPTLDSERWVDNRLGGPGGFLLWEDGKPVSLAGWGSYTPHGVRVGPVYTPPEHRRRGYGSAVTAAVSAAELAAGRRFCFLYTDLANPTSNRIYVDIGYEPVCDSIDYAFDSR